MSKNKVFRRSHKTQERHEKFIAAYKANPLNELKGRFVHKLQRTCKTQSEMERKAHEYIALLERLRAA